MTNRIIISRSTLKQIDAWRRSSDPRRRKFAERVTKGLLLIRDEVSGQDLVDQMSKVFGRGRAGGFHFVSSAPTLYWSSTEHGKETQPLRRTILKSPL